MIPIADQLTERLTISGMLFDGALRGTHVDDLVRRHGIICIAPPIAEKVDKTTRARTERKVPLPEVTATRPGGSTSKIALTAVRGAACEVHHNESGGGCSFPSPS